MALRPGRRRIERMLETLVKLSIVYGLLFVVGSMHIPVVSGVSNALAGVVLIILFIYISFIFIIGVIYVVGSVFSTPTRRGPPRPPRGWRGEWWEAAREHAELAREVAEEVRREAQRAMVAIRRAVEEFRRGLDTGQRVNSAATANAPGASVEPAETRRVLPQEWDSASGARAGFPVALRQRFRPLEMLGEGGFSVVWKVESTRPPGVYALKIPRLPASRESRRVFAREAVHWSDLGVHPNIVRLYEWDTDPIPWLLVEYVPGVRVGGSRARSLRELLYLKNRLPVCLALVLALDAARGLEHAHSRGIAHLDVKPSNILLAPASGRLAVGKLTDWGMSKVASGTASVSGASPGYMAPEHFPFSRYKEKGLGWWTDVYQLGLVLYECVTGVNYNQVLLESSPGEALARVEDPGVRSLLGTMLDPDPERRPATGEVVARLEDLLSRAGCRG